MSASQEQVIEAMSDPALYPHCPASVQVVQTHISVVFLAGDLVYKIKKPLDLGFLDFTTLEKRLHFCRQEIILNSRFSDGIYLGVANICRGPSGLNLDGAGEPVEAAVVMRRVPDDRIMLNMLDRDQVTPQLLDRLSDRLAFFHSTAATGPQIASFGSVAVVRQNVTENFEQTVPYIGRTIDGRAHQAISALSLEFLASNEDLIKNRVKHGYVRDCHGDLHLDHVVITDSIMLIDCIEFNDRFRYSDTAADLAFLLMDLDFRGYPAFSRHIAERYAESSRDRQVLQILNFYQGYRAFVRGKVNSFTLDEPEVSQSEKEIATQTARDYFRLSLSYMAPRPAVALIVVCGLIGTGKSFLAAKLGTRLGIAPIQSDIVRKTIHSLAPDEHRLDKYGEGIYTSGATEQTYQALLEAARRRLAEGKSVILDATFMRFDDRVRARELAVRHNATFRLIECVAPEEVIQQRLERRIKQSNEPSDGRWELFPAHKAGFEPIRQEEFSDHLVWDSTTEPHRFLAPFVRELFLS